MNAWRQVSGLRPENPAQKSLRTCNVTGVRMSLGNPADKLPGAEGIKPFTLVIPQYGTAIAFQKGGKGCAVFFWLAPLVRSVKTCGPSAPFGEPPGKTALRHGACPYKCRSQADELVMGKFREAVL